MNKWWILTLAAVVPAYNFIYLFAQVKIALIFAKFKMRDIISLADSLIIFFNLLMYTQFCSTMMVMLACSYCMLRRLNRQLEENLVNPTCVLSPKLVKSTARMYNKLCDTYEAISLFYFVNFMLYLLAFTYFAIYACYSAYIFLRNPNLDILLFMLTSLWWLFFYSPCVLWMITFSSWIQQESHRTVDIMELMMRPTTDLRTDRDVQLFSLMVSHRAPNISSGLFVLDWKMFFKMLGGIFSFSVIAIQFYDVPDE